MVPMILPLDVHADVITLAVVQRDLGDHHIPPKR